MYLKTNVKLGEVSSLSDARFAAGIGAQFLGFNFSPDHPSYIAPSAVQEIVGWLTGPCLVGEWEHELTDIIRDTRDRLHLDYIQLNQFDPAQANELQDCPLIQNLPLQADTTIPVLIEMMQAVKQHELIYMLSFETAEAQTHFMKQPGHAYALTEMCRDYPVLFNFHFSPDNLLPMLETYHPFGINLKGSPELKPGYKDFDELNELVELLESEI